MKIWIEKELFQWEKDRYVCLEFSNNEPQIDNVQFYNSKDLEGQVVPLKNQRAKIPNYLLKESLPIMAVACVGSEGDTKVIGRKSFRVLKRARPEFYYEEPEDSITKEIIYDGGEEV